ncbi:hypothetical protein [Clostridium sp. ZBS18]|uniref:hypothetical protein n=1 Tax=Clostridium sp. ZBS18 TaxID=2949967 RepID=UPI00207A5DC2|nr:hypothetical protein [Clostridium sp. ZBS18]
MCVIINKIDNYEILKVHNGYIVKNIKGIYENHGHFKKLDTCYLIIDLIKHKKIPKSKYLLGSAIRLTTDEKYKNTLELKRNKLKDNYYNVNKGVK